MVQVVESLIERRLLVNYRIDPDRVAPLLPPGLRPQLQRGFAVGGMCLLRLSRLRVPALPRGLGLRSENAAHRFAVEWDDDAGTQVGVYVPRRDTGSALARRAGGLLFPGRYEPARFTVDERLGSVAVEVASTDGRVRLGVRATEADELGGELFDSLDEALGFFRRGSLGLSPSRRAGYLDRVRLESLHWEGRPMAIEEMSSSLFDDEGIFPRGSCVLDSAVVMRDLPVRWVADSSSCFHHGVLAA
ncbi:MAG TPA: DUF2071 domain-containing protein [Acidimicrobiales bacterium]|nr:DUF2071 domain-containing protein [Acidimicrobiales bacterium]